MAINLDTETLQPKPSINGRNTLIGTEMKKSASTLVQFVSPGCKSRTSIAPQSSYFESVAGRIQPVRLRGAISVIFGCQVS